MPMTAAYKEGEFTLPFRAFGLNQFREVVAAQFFPTRVKRHYIAFGLAQQCVAFDFLLFFRSFALRRVRKLNYFEIRVSLHTLGILCDSVR